MKVLLTATFVLSLVGCKHQLTESQKLYFDEIHQSKFWGDFQNKSIKEKIQTIPLEMLKHISKDNQIHGRLGNPSPFKITPEFQENLYNAIDSIPKDLLKLINPKLVAICLVNNLGSSGYSEFVMSAAQEDIGGVIVLDAGAIDKNANDWMTWKENLPFKADQKYKLTAVIENKKQNNVSNTIQYLLLHEFGHILSIGMSEVSAFGGEDFSPADLVSKRQSTLDWFVLISPVYMPRPIPMTILRSLL